MNRLGELERAIMEILWESTDLMTVRQVGAGLVDRDLAHTTVMTVLDRLAKKGFVKRERAGRAWRGPSPFSARPSLRRGRRAS